MRTIGLLGGLTWHATVRYYTRINEKTAEIFGPGRSAQLLIRSVDWGDVQQAMADGSYKRLAKTLLAACRDLERGGAEVVVICSNTIHALVSQLAPRIGIPILHIADCLAKEAHARGHQRLLLLGTRHTMTAAFFRERLERHGLIIVGPRDPGAIDKVITEELTLGQIRPASRDLLVSAIEQHDVDAAVLGCTELGLLLSQEHTDVPLLDTALIHAEAALLWSLER